MCRTLLWWIYLMRYFWMFPKIKPMLTCKASSSYSQYTCWVHSHFCLIVNHLMMKLTPLIRRCFSWYLINRRTFLVPSFCWVPLEIPSCWCCSLFQLLKMSWNYCFMLCRIELKIDHLFIIIVISWHRALWLDCSFEWQDLHQTIYCC